MRSINRKGTHHEKDITLAHGVVGCDGASGL
jgi:hypothetical protein